MLTQTLLYLTTFLHILLGIYLIYRGSKNRSYTIFAISLISIGLWSFSNVEFANSVDKPTMVFWVLVAYNAATMMLASVSVFSRLYSRIETKTGFYVFISTFTLFALVIPYIPNLVFTDVSLEQKAIIGGPFLPVLFLTDFIYLGITAWHLSRGIRKFQGAEKQQIKIVSLGIGLTGLFGIVMNLVLPAFNNYSFVTVGPVFTLLFLSLVTYNILRHRFLDVRVLIGRITYYFTVGLVPFSAFFFFAWFYITIFGDIFNVRVYLVSPFVAILFVFAFNGLNNYIRNQVNSRFINPGYDPLATAERLSNELSLIIDLPTISERITGVIQRTIRPEYAAIVVFPQVDESGNQTSDFRVFHSLNKEITETEKFKTIVSTIWQSMGRYPIVFDELEDEMTRGAFRNMPNLVRDLQPLMKDIGAKVILSIGDKDNIKGMFVVGSKEADYPYSSQDIEFLKSIANNGSLAIERSLLYGEVQEFANTLQKKVDVATAELTQANTDLQATLQQLQEARRQERDMMDVMGHELRTPITIVRNALSMLNREKEKTNGNIPPEHLDKYLEMAMESIRREITLIETLLSATKIDGARLQIYSTKVDFTDVVNDAIEGQKAMAEQKGIKINYTPPANLIYVYADRTRIQEVMDNFLSNAVKYTLEGSVSIDIWEDDKYGWISVKDSGIGISEPDLQNLGKKFFRAKQYVNNEQAAAGSKVVRPGGTGLGLYVTFDLIKVMGGELYINSKVGEGSTFTFCMPHYTNQPDQQYDQTFDTTSKVVERSHVHINEQVPRVK